MTRHEIAPIEQQSMAWIARYSRNMATCKRGSSSSRTSTGLFETPFRSNDDNNPEAQDRRGAARFRSSFRHWAAEETNHPREVIEAASGHVVRKQGQAAYRRTDLPSARALTSANGGLGGIRRRWKSAAIDCLGSSIVRRAHYRRSMPSHRNDGVVCLCLHIFRLNGVQRPLCVP